MHGLNEAHHTRFQTMTKMMLKIMRLINIVHQGQGEQMDLSFWGDYSPESVVQVPLHTAAQHASECHTFFNTSQLFRTVGHDPHLQPNLPSAFFAMLTILSAERMELCNMKSMNSDVSRHYIESNSLQKKQTELETRPAKIKRTREKGME